MAYTPRGTPPGRTASDRGSLAERGPGTTLRPSPPALRPAVRTPGAASGYDGGGPAHPSGGPSPTVRRGRRELPYWTLGVVLVVAGALSTMLLVSRSHAQISVLALARDVPLGQTLTAADLWVERAAAGTTVATVPASQASAMVGRVAAVPLRVGRLLAPDDVGPAAWPPAGQLLLGVSVGPGAAPPELAAGLHVLVGTGTADTSVATAGGSGSGLDVVTRNGLAGAPEAVVAGVRDSATGTGDRVVSLLLTREGAGQVTAIPASQLRLVVLPAAPPAPATSPAQPGPSSGPSAAPSGGGA